MACWGHRVVRVIFLDLKLFQLMPCHRVCQTFRATIEGSINLDRQHLLKSEPEHNYTLRINRRMRGHDCFSKEDLIERSAIDPDRYFPPWYGHPQYNFRPIYRFNFRFFCQHRESKTGRKGTFSKENLPWVDRLHIKVRPLESDARFTSRLDLYSPSLETLDSDASCRKMYLTQPPLKRVRVLTSYIEKPASTYSCGKQDQP